MRHRDRDRHRLLQVDVLRIVDGQIAEITTFGPAHFAQLGLPETLVDSVIRPI